MISAVPHRMLDTGNLRLITGEMNWMQAQFRGHVTLKLVQSSSFFIQGTAPATSSMLSNTKDDSRSARSRSWRPPRARDLLCMNISIMHACIVYNALQHSWSQQCNHSDRSIDEPVGCQQQTCTCYIFAEVAPIKTSYWSIYLWLIHVCAVHTSLSAKAS